MILKCLLAWKAKNGKFPDNIIIYRDGVSEGQYTQVLEQEYRGEDWTVNDSTGEREPGEKNRSICAAFARIYGQEHNWPNVSIIVSL